MVFTQETRVRVPYEEVRKLFWIFLDIFFDFFLESFFFVTRTADESGSQSVFRANPEAVVPGLQAILCRAPRLARRQGVNLDLDDRLRLKGPRHAFCHPVALVLVLGVLWPCYSFRQGCIRHTVARGTRDRPPCSEMRDQH